MIRTLRRTFLAMTSGLLLLPAILPAWHSAEAQVIVKTVGPDSGVRVMRFDADKAFLLPETGAVVLQQGKDLRVDRVQPASTRKDPYKEVDLQEGDLVLLCNGKRVKEIKVLHEAYDAVAAGQEVKLGLQRGELMLSVTFPKADPKEFSGMRMVRVQGDSGSFVPELGLLLEAGKEGVKVKELLPSETRPQNVTLAAGDLIKSVNKSPVHTLKDFNKVFDKAGPGGTVTLEVTRRGETLSMAFAKPKKSGNVIIRTLKRP